jgi:enediyne biosynthesis protein E4
LRIAEVVKTGSSYLSQSELPLTFGLGKTQEGKTAAITIDWPSGKKDLVANIKPNQFLSVQEGKGIVSAQPLVRTK